MRSLVTRTSLVTLALVLLSTVAQAGEGHGITISGGIITKTNDEALYGHEAKITIRYNNIYLTYQTPAGVELQKLVATLPEEQANNSTLEEMVRGTLRDPALLITSEQQDSLKKMCAQEGARSDLPNVRSVTVTTTWSEERHQSRNKLGREMLDAKTRKSYWFLAKRQRSMNCSLKDKESIYFEIAHLDEYNDDSLSLRIQCMKDLGSSKDHFFNVSEIVCDCLGSHCQEQALKQ